MTRACLFFIFGFFLSRHGWADLPVQGCPNFSGIYYSDWSTVKSAGDKKPIYDAAKANSVLAIFQPNCSHLTMTEYAVNRDGTYDKRGGSHPLSIMDGKDHNDSAGGFVSPYLYKINSKSLIQQANPAMKSERILNGSFVFESSYIANYATFEKPVFAWDEEHGTCTAKTIEWTLSSAGDIVQTAGDVTCEKAGQFMDGPRQFKITWKKIAPLTDYTLTIKTPKIHVDDQSLPVLFSMREQTTGGGMRWRPFPSSALNYCKLLGMGQADLNISFSSPAKSVPNQIPQAASIAVAIFDRNGEPKSMILDVTKVTLLGQVSCLWREGDKVTAQFENVVLAEPKRTKVKLAKKKASVIRALVRND